MTVKTHEVTEIEVEEFPEIVKVPAPDGEEKVPAEVE